MKQKIKKNQGLGTKNNSIFIVPNSDIYLEM